MKNILIVGGAGFIGHHLAVDLKKRNYRVDIIDNFSVNHYGQLIARRDLSIKDKELYLSFLDDRMRLLWKNEIGIHQADARDYHAISAAFEKVKPDVVIHLAAVAHANISNKDPYTTFDHSLRTLENSLDASRKFNSHFIYFSSSMVYGEFSGNDVFEDSPLKPLGIYGNLKLCGETLVKSYNQTFGTKYTIIRPSALYGPRCISRRVLQVFIENCMNSVICKVQGNGENKIDFTYIDDLVDGVRLCIENDNSINETFNLTYGDSRSVKDAIDIISETFVMKVEWTDWDKLTPKRGTLRVDKAKELIGYNPEFPIEEGLRKYKHWYVTK